MTKYKKFKSFQKKAFKVFIKTFCKQWEGETLHKLFFIFEQLDKCQNDY